MSKRSAGVLGGVGMLGAVGILGITGAAQAQEVRPAPEPVQPAVEEQVTTQVTTTQPADPPLLSRYDRDPNRWEVSLEPAFWFVGASGRLRLPRSTPTGAPTGKLHLEDLNLDNPNFEPMVEVNVRRGDWRATARGAFFGAERDASGLTGSLGDISFTAGDVVRTNLDFTIIELEGAYTIQGKPQERQPDGSYIFDPRLDVVGGLRIYGEEWTVENLSGGTGTTRTEESDWFVQPQVGLKLSADLYRALTVDAQMSVGGLPTEDTSYTVDIIVGVQWRPVDNVGVQIGYRSLFFGMARGDGEGEFSFDGSLQGLYGGVVVRF